MGASQKPITAINVTFGVHAAHSDEWEVEEVKHPANASRFPRFVVSCDKACSLALNASKLFRILFEVGVPQYCPIFQGGSNENDVRKASTLLRAVPEIPA